MISLVRFIPTVLLVIYSLAGVPAHAALMTCTSATTYSLSDAIDIECFTGNDTNQIDKNFTLFGLQGWILSDKNDSLNGDGVIEFTDAPDNGDKSGNW